MSVYGEIPVFSPNAGKCGKNADQNNPKYELFLHSVKFMFIYVYIYKNWIKKKKSHDRKDLLSSKLPDECKKGFPQNFRR